GNWGWVPLAPYETYYPWYGRGYYGGYRNGVRNNVTIVNNTNITNIYRNARVDNAITSVNYNQFGRGSVNNVRYTRNDIERASVVRGQLPLVPDASSTRMSDRQTRISETRGMTRADNNFYSTRQPSRVDRVSFDSQRSAMQEVSRRTFGDTSPGRGGEVANGAGGRGSGDSFTGRVSGMDRTADAGGARRGSAESPSGSDRANGLVDRSAGRSADTGGWRRFGDSTGGATSADRGAGASSIDRGSARVDRGASVDRGSSVDRSAGRSSDTGGWRRFGDSTGGALTDRSSGSVDRGASRSTDSGSWRRMENGSSNADRGSSVDRGSFGRGSSADRSSGMVDRGGFDRGSSPMERSAPSMDRGSSVDRGSFGRGSMDSGRGSSRMESAPRRMESAPRMSAPPVVRERSSPGGGGGGFRMERSAPSGGGGGGFGGGRGGGGGGSRGESRGGGGGRGR
ncbi:MAG TPA: hypothetical protein VFQ91_01885, partial [Bryobacteraceae bacterium]|nr:hypothetical protein [Bryobacteraceae bacterium]